MASFNFRPRFLNIRMQFHINFIKEPPPLNLVLSPNVIITPNSLVPGQSAKFNVSGTLFNDLFEGIADLRIQFIDSSQWPIGNPYYQYFNESFPAGTSFSIVAPKVDVPSNLPSKYVIEVVIEAQILADIYGCSLADGRK
ncbi:hypothetical protein C2G38_2026797 [Gigaspora rosea]|uniref:Arrestin-like N-terminal domain-containing protein n=1 Tax=Gigaspora rosea TaxID=44941 RepID=A0A397W6X5_9GLOM|nr:hypothetical protein C2G38_2026797 [Gigaspora rosea]